MARKQPKPVPRRSVKSGIKKRKAVEKNMEVIKYIESYLKTKA